MRKWVCILLLVVSLGCGTPATVSPVPRSTAGAPAYTEIADSFATMTDAQWDAYAAGLVGTRVDRWAGEVVDVTHMANTYRVNVDMDTDGIFDVSFNVDADTGLALDRGVTIMFSGTIVHARRLFGALSIGLDEAILE